MERAIDEVFDFKGVKLQVKDIGDSYFCYRCYFYESKLTCGMADHINQVGVCFWTHRTDNKNVIFVEVKDKN